MIFMCKNCLNVKYVTKLTLKINPKNDFYQVSATLYYPSRPPICDFPCKIKQKAKKRGEFYFQNLQLLQLLV